MFRSLLVLAAAFAFTATVALADSAVVFRAPLRTGDASLSIRSTFGANPEGGRAWVNLLVEDNLMSGDDSGPHTVIDRNFQLQAPLPPLVYNADRRTVELTLPGQEPLVCAHVSTSMFGQVRTETTGICHLMTNVVRSTTADPVTGASSTRRTVEVTLVTPYIMVR